MFCFRRCLLIDILPGTHATVYLDQTRGSLLAWTIQSRRRGHKHGNHLVGDKFKKRSSGTGAHSQNSLMTKRQHKRGHKTEGTVHTNRFLKRDVGQFLIRCAPLEAFVRQCRHALNQTPSCVLPPGRATSTITNWSRSRQRLPPKNARAATMQIV